MNRYVNTKVGVMQMALTLFSRRSSVPARPVRSRLLWRLAAAVCLAFIALAGCGGGGNSDSFVSCVRYTEKFDPITGKYITVKEACPKPQDTISLARYVGKYQYCNGNGMRETREFKSADSNLAGDERYITRKGEALEGVTRYEVFEEDDCTGARVGLMEFKPTIFTGVTGELLGRFLFVKTDLLPLDTSGKEYELYLDGMMGGESISDPKAFAASGTGMSYEVVPGGTIQNPSYQYCFVRKPGVKVCSLDERWGVSSDGGGLYLSSAHTPGKTALWIFGFGDGGWAVSHALYKVE